MNEKLQNLIKENLMSLPKEAQEVINTFNWIGVCEEVGKAHKLLDPEIENLQTETALVLIGLEELRMYPLNIEKEVEITREDAENISKEITEKIFKPIAEQITEKIKSKVKDGGQKWNQNIDFIVSGGDYSAFIDRREPIKTEESSDNKNKTVNPVKKMDDFKKVEDLKSKFTI